MKTILLFAIFYAVIGLFLSYKQESLVYQPGVQDFESCPDLKEAERLTYEGTRMYFKKNGPRVAVIYHGNAGSACDRAFIASIFGNIGYSYLLPEYAGYSNDSAKPSHAGIKKDVEHVIDFLDSRDFKNIVVLGESVGTGVASYHASLKPVSQLILISPFTDLVDVAQEAFWFYPASLLVENAFDNEQLLAAYRGKVLVLHGDADTVIPSKLGEELFESLRSPDKQLAIIRGAGHNTMFWYPETYESITSFVGDAGGAK